MSTDKMKYKTKIIDGIEYEIETHNFNRKLSDIKIPKGWRLWTAEECIKLHNSLEFRNMLNLEDCWFFIQQPFRFNFEKDYVARFGADSGWANLSCVGYPTGTYSSLGVRFCREVKK
jgi:hypothetical protein